MLRSLARVAARSAMGAPAPAWGLAPAAPSVAASIALPPAFSVERGVKISADELKTGMLLDHDGKKMTVLSYKAAMMGRRPTSLFIEMRDTATGKVFPYRLSPSDRLERIVLETADWSFLYVQDGIAYLMHPETFEQLEVDAKVLGTAGLYLPADAKVKVSLDNGAVHSITPYSETAVLEVVDTDAYSADTRVANDGSLKPAKLSNGRTVKVPRFVQKGTKIKVRITDESFVSREEK